jgi:signal transduction histidine kinase
MEHTIKSVNSCAIKNSFCKFEFRIKTDTDEIKWFRCSMQVTERNEKEEPTLIVGVNVDITKEHSMLDTIRQQEETLAQSRKLKAMGQLTGGIAHDFNNMLATIMGFAELLSEDLQEDEEKSYYCKNITDTCERAATLTNQLLTFSRKQGRLTTAIDLHVLIQNSMDLLQHSLGKNIKIKKNLEAKEHYIMGEFAQLQNILLNMGFNARDAMPNGGVLELTTENVAIYEKDLPQLPVDIQPG